MPSAETLRKADMGQFSAAQVLRLHLSAMTERIVIDEFLRQKRIALVGVSQDPHDFSRAVWADLKASGYDVVPVNPALGTIDGIRAVNTMHNVDPPVDAAYIMTAPSKTRKVVEQCHDNGVDRVWLHRGAGPGSVSREAVDYCEAHHMKVIPGECIEMFLPKATWIHRWHRTLRKLAGHLPS